MNFLMQGGLDGGPRVLYKLNVPEKWRTNQERAKASVHRPCRRKPAVLQFEHRLVHASTHPRTLVCNTNPSLYGLGGIADYNVGRKVRCSGGARCRRGSQCRAQHDQGTTTSRIVLRTISSQQSASSWAPRTALSLSLIHISEPTRPY